MKYLKKRNWFDFQDINAEENQVEEEDGEKEETITKTKILFDALIEGKKEDKYEEEEKTELKELERV